MFRIVFPSLVLIVAGCLILITGASATDDIAAFRSQREAYMDQFRRTGARPKEPLLILESKLRTALNEAPAGNRSALLYELASVQRQQDRFKDAIATYHAAIEDAGGAGDVVFDSWMGIARASTNVLDHGAAAVAFQQAVNSAGAKPSGDQRYEIADYASQLLVRRGELEAALANVLEANHFAETDEDRFYAQLDAGDVLQNFAQSCRYRQLVDAKTFSSEDDDGWGACRRAVAAAGSYYAKAGQTAERMGWDFLRAESDDMRYRLDFSLALIEQRAAARELGDPSVFSAEDAGQVLVNEDFAAGGSLFTGGSALAEFIKRTVAEYGSENALATYLLGAAADIEGNREEALAYFERAVDLLERERASLFDVRQRGTVVENRPELVSDLALRLLGRGSYDRAFAAFESIRARGLGELAAAFEVEEFSDAERRRLASLVDLESQESAIQTTLVEKTIAGEERESDRTLGKFDAVRTQHENLLRDPEFVDTIERLSAGHRGTEGLADLSALVKKSGIPVLLYWVTQANVIVWVVGPDGLEVKTVRLPEAALVEKIRRVVESVRRPDRPFDKTAARQLYAYLIQPFERHLVGDEVVIVPQGPLVALPFEVLMAGRTGKFLVEKVAISYAPSAAIAAKALQRAPIALPLVTAVYDESLEHDTHEIQRLRRSLTHGLNEISSQKLSGDEAIKVLGGREAVHVLLHGGFNFEDPLQSSLSLNNPELSREEGEITAAELLASDWRGTRIAVFSSCESAQMNVRISNEVYGLSWAPLVGGAEAVVMSRWMVAGESNAGWMEDFYGRLAAGSGSPAIAAAGTMRRMILDGQANPYYWAGPQVLGR